MYWINIMKIQKTTMDDLNGRNKNYCLTYRSDWDSLESISTAVYYGFFSNNKHATKWWGNWYQ